MKKRLEIALNELVEHQWDAGNGQCDKCWGLGKGFYPQDDYERIGHKKGCYIGIIIRELGGETYFQGELQTDKTDPAWIRRNKYREFMNREFEKGIKEEIEKEQNKVVK